MINVSFGPNVFLSGILLFGVVLLYGLRKVKPEVSRDEDLFFVTIGFFLLWYSNGSWMALRSNITI